MEFEVASLDLGKYWKAKNNGERKLALVNNNASEGLDLSLKVVPWNKKKLQSSSSSQFWNESDLIFMLKQMFLVERLRLKVLKCWLHKRTVCKSLWKQMLRCTDLAHNMFASMHLKKYSIVPTFLPINISFFISTKGAFRRPMTFDNQSHPIHPSIRRIEWIN